MNSLTTPIIGLLVAVFVLIFLSVRTKVHPIIAMLIAACITGISGGMTTDETLKAITNGFGSTLGNIGIVIGLGVMLGRILEVSGAAEKIAFTFIQWLGKRKEEWALSLTGFIVSIPIFADSAFVILYPISKAMAAKGQRNVITLGVALAGGLIVSHTLVPPTPGPLGAAQLYGVDIGAMMIFGILLGIPCMASFVWYAKWLEKNFSYTENNSKQEAATDVNNLQKNLPGFSISLFPIVIPIFLIFLKALTNIMPAPSSEMGTVIFQLFNFVGSPIIALSIGTLVATYTLVKNLDRHSTSVRLEEGLQSAGIILLVTGAGGALGAVVRDSGTGSQIANLIVTSPISPIMLPFIVSTVIRFVQGSATVACITSASITAPILSQFPDLNMLIAAQSTVVGSFFFSYFNDSLFWIVSRMMGVVDVKQQLLTWSIPTTIAWAVGGIIIAVLNLIVGARGTLLDPLLPLFVLGVVFLIIRFKGKTTSDKIVV